MALEVVRFGVLGAARIAPNALILPASKMATVAVTRIAAREPSRAEAFASEHGIASVSDDYGGVIAADDVDVVYIPLPMSLHAEWTIAALDAGKHVLCEKPFASNATEATAMIAAAKGAGLVLGEAFHYRYHPMIQRIIDIIDGGVIGEVDRVEANFNISIDKPDLRWNYGTAGGATMDLGCYPIHWVRDLLGEPQVVAAQALVDSDDPRIDAELTAELSWPSGATGQVSSSMISADPKIDLRIVGSAGEIYADNPMAPQNGNLLTVTTEAGTTSGPVLAGISYDHMLRAFVDHLVLGTTFVTSGRDSIANMAVIDATYRAAGLAVRGASGIGD